MFLESERERGREREKKREREKGEREEGEREKERGSVRKRGGREKIPHQSTEHGCNLPILYSADLV